MNVGDDDLVSPGDAVPTKGSSGGILQAVRATGRAIRRSRSMRLRSLRILRAHRDLLTPGPFVCAGPQLWRHWRAAVPSHLAATKGHGRQLIGAQVRLGPSRRRHLGLLHRIALALTGPVVTRGTGRAATNPFPLAVAARGGGLLLIDPAGHRIARVDDPRFRDPAVADLHRRFARHVPTPACEIQDGGRLVLEEYVDGSHLSSLPPDAQVNAIRALFDAAERLVTAEREAAEAGPVAALLALVRAPSVHPAARTMLERLERDLHLTDWPVVPAQGAAMFNLVITDTGPVIVDLDDLALRPFTYVPFSAIAGGTPQVRDALTAGRFDADIARLFRAAKVDLPRVDRYREPLLWLGVALDAQSRASRSGNVSTKDFVRQLATRSTGLPTRTLDELDVPPDRVDAGHGGEPDDRRATS